MRTQNVTVEWNGLVVEGTVESEPYSREDGPGWTEITIDHAFITDDEEFGEFCEESQVKAIPAEQGLASWLRENFSDEICDELADAAE